MAENENGMSKKKKVAIITASVVGVVAVLFLAIFLPIYLTQKSSETETVESNLPSGQTLNMLMKQNDDYTAENSTITRIVFDYYDKDESGEYTQTEDGNYTYTENEVNVLEGQEAESYVWNKTQIDVYRVSDAEDIIIYFLSTEDIVANEDMNYAFRNFTSVEEIVFNNFDTSVVTSMRYMFYLCTSLTTLDVSKWNTSNVTTMASLFNACNSLASIDLSNFDTRKVTDMGGMFAYCYALTTLDVSNFVTNNVTSMGWMFQSCTGLTQLDLSNFDTSKVTTMQGMFFNLTNVLTLDLSNFDTSNVTTMNKMFAYCRSLTELDISSFDTSKVTNMSQMFTDCSALGVIYIGEGWTTDAVEEGNDANMFYICSSLPHYTEYGRVTDKTYAYAGYNEELEKYGYLTDISEKDTGDLVGDDE